MENSTKSDKINEKHKSPLGLCDEINCKRYKCFNEYNLEKQLGINKLYNSLSNFEKNKFILENVIKISDNNDESDKKSEKYIYKLLGKQVCRKFFLNTLGLKTATKVEKLLKKFQNSENSNLNEVLKDKRILNGRRKSQEFVNRIESFIESFDPKPSHYKLSNAPKRKYIDSEYINFANQMNFKPILKANSVENRNNINEHILNSCNYDYFIKKFREKNIGFSVPSTDLCDKCETYISHSSANLDCDCLVCVNYEKHCENYRKARNLINIDKNLSNIDLNTIVLNGDLMKVIPVPVLKNKNSNFSEKITVYNQTFCQLGSDKKSFCLVSHDAEIRKTANEFVNFILQFIMSEFCSEFKNLIIWFDNCCAQNKNYLLFTSFISIINDPSVKLENITFKYLEVGHTYMAADSLHGNISQKIKEEKYIFSPIHFISHVQNSRKNVFVKYLTYRDILIFQNHYNNKKNFAINNVKMCQFRKNSYNIHIKTDYDEDFKSFDILERNFKNSIIESKNYLNSLLKLSKPRGVSQHKYNELQKATKNLEPIYKSFYDNLFINDEFEEKDEEKDEEKIDSHY
jgi:hypothetical protein